MVLDTVIITIYYQIMLSSRTMPRERRLLKPGVIKYLRMLR